jgi:hypothetical protein
MDQDFPRGLPLRNLFHRFDGQWHRKNFFDFRFIDVQCHGSNPLRIIRILA